MKNYLKCVAVVFLIGLFQNCTVREEEGLPVPKGKAARVAACTNGISYSFIKEGPNDGNDHYFAPGSESFKKQIKISLYNFSASSRYVSIRFSGGLGINQVVSQTGGTVNLSTLAGGQHYRAEWGVTVPTYGGAQLVLEIQMNGSVESLSYLSLMSPCLENNDPELGVPSTTASDVKYYVIKNSSL
jgi:hypothetical protein